MEHIKAVFSEAVFDVKNSREISAYWKNKQSSWYFFFFFFK